MNKNVVIVSAKRTAIGKLHGSLSKIPAHQLSADIMKDILNTLKLDAALIDEVIIGQVLTAGNGQNPARQASIAAGLPESIPSLLINKVCASGLKAIQLATQSIMCGDSSLVFAGGQENMSLAPYLLSRKNNHSIGHLSVEDSLIKDGLWDSFNNYHMGITAENISSKYKITRKEQDKYALNSTIKSVKARDSGRFKDEISPIIVSNDKGAEIVFSLDEQPRKDTSFEKLSNLHPVFSSDGTVTAGNSSSLNDGASILLLASEEKANELKLPILARIKGFSCVGYPPDLMGLAPIESTNKLLSKLNWKISDLDLIELNEAFSAQAIAVNNVLAWNENKVNVNGGAISLGHPLGASGARILTTLVHELNRQGLSKGLATLCVGGGQGISVAIEK